MTKRTLSLQQKAVLLEYEKAKRLGAQAFAYAIRTNPDNRDLRTRFDLIDKEAA